MPGSPSGGESCFLVMALNSLVKEGLDYELKVCKQDELGCYVILKLLCKVDNLCLQISMLQIMATSSVFFYDEIHNELAKLEGDEDHRIIRGGDFNVILDPYFRWIRIF